MIAIPSGGIKGFRSEEPSRVTVPENVRRKRQKFMEAAPSVQINSLKRIVLELETRKRQGTISQFDMAILEKARKRIAGLENVLSGNV